MSSVLLMSREELNKLHAEVQKMAQCWNELQSFINLKTSVDELLHNLARDNNQAIDKLKDDMEKAMWAIKELARCVRGLSKHIAKNHPESYPGGWSDVDIGEYSDSEEEILKRIVPNLTDDEPVWMEEEEEEEI